MEPPVLGYFIFILATILAVTIQLIQFFLVDMEKREFYMRELNKWRKKAMLARKTGDPKLLAEVQKEYPRIQLIQQELSKEMMKMMLASFTVLFVFIILLRVMGRETIVIVAPFNIPFDIPLMGSFGARFTIDGDTMLGFYLFWWYILAAAPLTTLFSTIIRIRQIKKSIRLIRKKRVKKRKMI